VRAGDLGLGNFFENWSLAVSVQSDCFHGGYFLCTV
jgi:hypothetical protein